MNVREMTSRETLWWLAIYALLALFSSGKWSLAPVVWLVPALGLYIIHRSPTRRGFFLLLGASYIPGTIAWHGVLPLPWPLFALFMLFNTFVAIVPYLIDRILTPRLGTSFGATLVFPLAVTAIEFLMMADGPLGSFGAQAYTQYSVVPLAQFASVGGLWGITFVVSWFASVAHWAVSRVEAGRSVRHGLATYGAVVGALLLFGAARLLAAPQPQESVTVASFTAVQVDMGEMMSLRDQDEEAFRARTRDQHHAYLEQSVRATESGARIVLWPELAGLGMADDVQRLVADGQALADEHDIYLAMPLFILDPKGATPAINKIVVADPAGAIVLEHVKYGGNVLEGTVPGSRVLQTVETPFGTLSAVICWDTDYPAVVRQAGAQGVDILLSPAYVWPAVASMHAEMATFRSIENGLTLVRQSDNGFSLISDAYGRVVARENHIGQEGVMMVVAAPLGHAQTLYPILGDIIGQASVAGLLLSSLAVAASRWRGRLSLPSLG